MKHIEELVLNTLIVCPETWVSYGMMLTSDDFTGERRDVFSAIRRRAMEHKPLDYGVLLETLADIPGAVDAVDAIAGCATAAHTLDDYVSELKEGSMARRAERIADELLKTGDIAAARKALSTLHGPSRGYAGAHEASIALMDELERRSTGEATGLKTGLSALDDLVEMEPGDLCVIAARPSMGKTALMLNIARRSGVPVGIFSLEMTTPQLMTRLVAMDGVDYGKLRRPRQLTEDEWPQITKATKAVNEQGMWINDTGGLSMNLLESDAYRMVREHGVKLLCVDYLQLVTCKADSRLNEVSEVSRRLKALAKNLAVPVIALSQLNRRTETGGKPKPQMSDLRESGQIEQDADQIVFIYRPEMYVKDEHPGEAQLVVAKNRAGETGEPWVGWQGRYQRFVNLIHDNYPRAVA